MIEVMKTVVDAGMRAKIRRANDAALEAWRKDWVERALRFGLVEYSEKLLKAIMAEQSRRRVGRTMAVPAKRERKMVAMDA